MSEMNEKSEFQNCVCCGFDPGRDGAAAFLWGAESLVVPYDRAEYIAVLKSFINKGFSVRAVVEHVRPAKWKKEFSGTSDKNTSIEVAKRLFPGVDLRRTERCTKDHDGKAEALLLAEISRRRVA